MNIIQIKPRSSQFTEGLVNIYNPPQILHYLGKLPPNRPPTIAIVGSRKPTAYGKEIVGRIAFDLASRGVVIISGLALGIDALAHRACLEAKGTTIAVLGSGLNDITPRTNLNLAHQILDTGGAIISEYKPDQPAMPHQFLERNRLVSGLADAVIIIEAAKRSGTLSTAAHALSQGRDVFAVPGNITSPLSEGCNNLIKQGANLITSAEDVLERLGLGSATDQNQPKLPLSTDPIEQQIIDLIYSGQSDGDAILSQLEIDASQFNLALTMLEVKGLIKPLGSNNWTHG